MNSGIAILTLVILGLAFGSFINAYVWRLHKGAGLKSKKQTSKYSILTGRSICPKCEHRLSTADLIPIASWLYLRGKCRYCHRAISPIYPIVEVVTTVLLVLSYIYWPLGFSGKGIFYFIIWLALLSGLIALASYDAKWLKLPNVLVYTLAVLVAAQVIITVIFFNGGLHYIGDVLLGLLIGGGVFYILFLLSSGKWIGGGDVKLGAILGIYLGSGVDAILMIFFASVLGCLYSLPLLGIGKLNRKTLIPYGPFLILATIILRLFGVSINTWLKNKGLFI